MLNCDSDRLLLKDKRWENEEIVHVRYFRLDDGEILDESSTYLSFHMWQKSKIIKMYKLTDGIAVHPKYRGRGIGKNLICIMEDIAKRANIGLINVSGVVNSGFFNKMGYTLSENDNPFWNRYTKSISPKSISGRT